MSGASIDKCIKEAIKRQVLTKDQGKHAKRMFEDKTKSGKLDTYDAKAAVIQIFDKLYKRELNKSLRTAIKQTKNRGEIDVHKDLQGRNNPAGWMEDKVEHMGGHNIQDVAGRQRELIGHFQGKLNEMLYHYRKTYWKGDLARNEAELAEGLKDIARESFKPGSTGNKDAAKFAVKFGEIAEEFRVLYNHAGGNIPKMKWTQWGLPMSHDQDAIVKMGRQAWIDYTFTRLDREKMLDWDTLLQMTDAELKTHLGKVHDHIRTGGASDRTAGEAIENVVGTVKDNADPRFLHFKDADAWLDYNNNMGIRDVYGTMIDYGATFSRDIATAELLGTNAPRMYKWAGQYIKDKYQTGEFGSLNLKMRAQNIDEYMVKFKGSIDYMKGSKASNEKLFLEYLNLEKQLDGTREIRNMDFFKGKGSRKLLGQEGEAAYGEKLQRRRASLKRKIEAKQEAILNKLDMTKLSEVEHTVVHHDLRNVFGDLSRYEDLPFQKILNDDSVNGYVQRGLDKLDIITEVQDPNMHRGLALWSGSVRNLITASSLGSASVSALTDHAYSMLTRYHNGMDVLGHFGDFTKMLNPKNRMEMVAQEMILDNAIRVAQIEARNGASINTNGWTGFAADRVIGVSGLSGITQVAKHAFSWEFSQHMARNIKQDWGALDPRVRTMLKHHNISEKEFNLLKTVGTYGAKGADFLRSQDVRKVSSELATKYHSMMTRERLHAVPEANIRTRRLLSQGHKKGTKAGEAMSHLTLFKSFSVTVMTMHAERIIARNFQEGAASSAKYAAGLLAMTTILGYMVLQIKEAKKGRTPLPMDKGMFWNSMLQGGGLGVAGDIFNSGFVEDRFGSSPLVSMAGPTASRTHGLIKGIGKVTGDNDWSKLSKEALRTIPGSNIWATQLLWERAVVDNLTHLLTGDKKYKKSWKRFNKGRESNWGNAHWWAPTGSE